MRPRAPGRSRPPGRRLTSGPVRGSVSPRSSQATLKGCLYMVLRMYVMLWMHPSTLGTLGTRALGHPGHPGTLGTRAPWAPWAPEHLSTLGTWAPGHPGTCNPLIADTPDACSCSAARSPAPSCSSRCSTSCPMGQCTHSSDGRISAARAGPVVLAWLLAFARPRSFACVERPWPADRPEEAPSGGEPRPVATRRTWAAGSTSVRDIMTSVGRMVQVRAAQTPTSITTARPGARIRQPRALASSKTTSPRAE